MKQRTEKGITLIALVITIIVLLILSSIAVSMLFGENGIITKAQEANFKAEIGKVEEQFKLYLGEKKLQNQKFEQGTLNAGETSLFYNTKDEMETGNIYTVLSDSDKKIVKDFEIIKGEMFFFTQDDKKAQWALEMGMKTNPYEIVDGVLISSDKNLFLLDKATGTITIPERVKEVGEGTFAGLEGVKKIIIPPTCKKINNSAFNGNDTLEEVLILADGDQGVETIGNYAFKDCMKLRIISMPNTVKDLGVGVFGNCRSLENVQLSNHIEVLSSQIFSNCVALKNINIPEGIKEMQGFLFQGATALANISLPASVEIIDNNCFYDATANLENINLNETNQHFIVENGMLLSKSKTQIYVVTKKTIIGNIFTVPNGIEYIGSGVLIPFFNITKVIIPESVNQIDAGFFPGSIEEIEISLNNPNYISINKQILSKDKKILYFCYSKASTITLEEGIEELKGAAVEKCNNASIINFPTTLKRLESQSLKGIYNVKNIKLGRNVEKITGDVFQYNFGVQNIEIDSENPNFIAENAAIYTKDMTKIIAFVNNEATNFQIPEGVNEIKVCAFSCREKLTEVILPQTLKRIETSAFHRCSALPKIEIPNSVEKMDGWGIFDECQNLREIIVDKEYGSLAGSPWGCIFGDRVVKWLR
ncbi:MAG: leucine-rich repeat protein [Clostridia bacterium]|nr:leucine-rich repeat protein [Clostridia bacterium]